VVALHFEFGGGELEVAVVGRFADHDGVLGMFRLSFRSSRFDFSGRVSFLRGHVGSRLVRDRVPIAVSGERRRDDDELAAPTG